MMNATSNDFGPERFHPRVTANFMVKAMVQGRLVLTKAKDLSMAGISLIGPIGHEGDKVTVALPLPHDREILTAGRITRENAEGVALEFDPLDWDDMFALARFLHPRLP